MRTFVLLTFVVLALSVLIVQAQKKPAEEAAAAPSGAPTGGKATAKGGKVESTVASKKMPGAQSGGDAKSKWVVAGGKRIKAIGKSGWIQFCDEKNDPNADSDGADDKCVSVRAFGFDELDSSNKTVAKKSVNNMGTVTTFGAAEIRNLTRCITKEDNGCGANDKDEDLQYVVIPISVDLASTKNFATGTLKINALIFADSGKYQFDGKNYSMTNGTTKFNIDLDDYTFDSTGKYVSFDVVVKNKNKEDPGEKSSKNGGIEVGPLFNLPRYIVWSATDEKSTKDANVVVNTKGSQKVITYKFEGPFKTMSYDPIVTVAADSTNNNANGAGTTVASLFLGTLMMLMSVMLL